MKRLDKNFAISILKYLFLFAGLYYIYFEFKEIDYDIVKSFGIFYLIIAFLFFLSGTSLFAYTWFRLLNVKKNISTIETIKIYFQGQLGKYIPGSVWSAIGRIGLAVDMGLELKFVSKTTINHLIYLWSSCLVVGVIFLIDFKSAIFIFIGSIIILSFMLSRNIIFYFIGWMSISISYIILFYSLGEISLNNFNLIINGSLFSWLGGFLFFPAPSGIGVREYILTFLLENKEGLNEVVLIAALARLLTIFNDLSGYFLYNFIFKFYNKNSV